MNRKNVPKQIIFTDQERLIENVESIPLLWDYKLAQYHDKNLKQSLWKKIGKNLGLTGT